LELAENYIVKKRHTNVEDGMYIAVCNAITVAVR
jgi:hypothetical protein